MEKRELETLMSKEAAEDFGLNLKDLIKVRRKDGTYYIYKEEVSKEAYLEVIREERKYQKRRQRMFKEMAEKGESLISLDQSIENTDFEVESEEDLEEMAITRLMLEVLQGEINKLPSEDKKLMDLVFHTDLSQRKLAQMLEVSQKTISNRIRKNIEILKNKLLK